jgi:hypothetical protein
VAKDRYHVFIAGGASKVVMNRRDVGDASDASDAGDAGDALRLASCAPLSPLMTSFWRRLVAGPGKEP